MSDTTESAVESATETEPTEVSVVGGVVSDITPENYALLIHSAGLTREEVADENGQATEAIKVVIATTPFLIQVDGTWVLCCPDMKYAEFLAVDQNWLDVLESLEHIEAGGGDEDGA